MAHLPLFVMTTLGDDRVGEKRRQVVGLMCVVLFEVSASAHVLARVNGSCSVTAVCKSCSGLNSNFSVVAAVWLPAASPIVSAEVPGPAPELATARAAGIWKTPGGAFVVGGASPFLSSSPTAL